MSRCQYVYHKILVTMGQPMFEHNPHQDHWGWNHNLHIGSYQYHSVCHHLPLQPTPSTQAMQWLVCLPGIRARNSPVSN